MKVLKNNSDECVFLITENDNFESITEKELISEKKEKPRIAKKITFDIPTTFKGRNLKKMKTTKTIFQIDAFRKNIFGLKDDDNKIECNILITEPTAETISKTVLQFIKLEYENISLDENEVFVGETFADMFFIAGLPYKGSKVFTESDKLIAPCRHKDCSILLSYRPDLLHRFPGIDYKGFELNSHVIIFK